MSTPGIYFDGTDANDMKVGTGGDDSIGMFAGEDSVWDGRGDDYVSLGVDNDLMFACRGNDFYDGGSGVDSVILHTLDMSSNGSYKEDNIYGVTFDLAITSRQNLGLLGFDTFVNFENVSGSLGSDRLYGNAGANNLFGDLGNDILDGRAGNDYLDGDKGVDRLVGGLGKDLMVAGTNFGVNDNARDTFAYRSIADSGLTAATRDSILYFYKNTGVTGDRINLSAIDANPTVKGNQAFAFAYQFHSNKMGEVLLKYSGTSTVIYVDIDKDTAPEMSILVIDAHLTRADLIL